MTRNHDREGIRRHGGSDRTSRTWRAHRVGDGSVRRHVPWSESTYGGVHFPPKVTKAALVENDIVETMPLSFEDCGEAVEKTPDLARRRVANASCAFTLEASLAREFARLRREDAHDAGVAPADRHPTEGGTATRPCPSPTRRHRAGDPAAEVPQRQPSARRMGGERAMVRLMRPSLFALGLAAPLLSGCLELCYLGQAVSGQDEIWALSRPIEEAVADPLVPERTRAMLQLVADVKRFGEVHGLAPTTNYLEYADLERDAVVWVVTSSHPLRFEATTWTFPIVGEVPYLGWFEEADARRVADSLAKRGRDVHVRAARAYSTLGWFRDPILSTMLNDGPEELVDVVLHESTHATHFVASQTVFNESLANFVAETLTERYLRERLGASAWRLYEHRDAELVHARRLGRLHDTYVELARLYASPADDATKLRRKAEILNAVRRELGLAFELNNASLLQLRAYGSGTDGFRALLETCDGDMRRFLRVVKTVGPTAFAESDSPNIDEVLEALAGRGCDAP